MSNGNGHHWSKFVWRDHTGDPALRACSLAARGYWMSMLCIMHEGTPVGHLTVNGRLVTTKQMAALAGCTEREAKKCEAELEESRIFSRTEGGVIYCRRMAREAVTDAAAREAWQAYGAAGGNPQIIRGTVAKGERQRPYRRSDAPQKTERIFQRDGGRCHWCNEQLDRDNPRHPLYFHVDHIVAVRDGGGTDEDNLVASCQRCNMRRARHTTDDDGPPKPNGHGTFSDTNPTEIPTPTLRKFRQQPSDAPTATLAPARESEPDSELEVREERKEDFNNYLDSLRNSARGDPAPTPAQMAVRNIVGRVTRSLDASEIGSMRPQGKRPKLTVLEQQNAVLRGPVIDENTLVGELLPPPRRGPCDPQRTVAEQLAALGYPELAERAAALP